MIDANLTPAPVGQQGPPARAATSDSWRGHFASRAGPSYGLPGRPAPSLTKGSGADINKGIQR